MANFGAKGRRGLLLGGVVLLLAGCLSPTLPLPPPARPDVSSPDAAGFVRITGRVQSYGTAYAENLFTGRITGQTTDETGKYELELAADVGDRLVIWYTLHGEASPTTEILVPESAAGLGGFGGSD